MVEEEFDRAGGIFLVAGTPVAGFACAWAVLGELHVLQIAVDPASRRNGVARALHAGLVQAARGSAGSGWLEVRAGNAAALAFYQQAGWQIVGRRPRYYVDGEDALLMRLDPLDSRPDLPTVG